MTRHIYMRVYKLHIRQACLFWHHRHAQPVLGYSKYDWFRTVYITQPKATIAICVLVTDMTLRFNCCITESQTKQITSIAAEQKH